MLIHFSIPRRRLPGRPLSPLIPEKVLGAGVAFGLAALGAGVAVGYAGSAAIAAIAEKPNLFGRALVIVVLGEGIANIRLCHSFHTDLALEDQCRNCAQKSYFERTLSLS